MPKKKAFPPPQKVTVTGLSHEGRGIAHLNGKTTFVFGALPEEVVLCKTVKNHRRYDEGTALEVESPHPERVIPKCQHFSVCGGCNLQHLSSLAQIRHKETILLEHLQHQARITPVEIATPLIGDAWQYRRKARLSVKFDFKKNKMLVGFREQNPRYIAGVTHCEILPETIGPRIYLWSDLLSTLDGKTSIPQIEIAQGDNAIAVIVRHLNPLSQQDLQTLIQFAKTESYQLYLQPKGPDTIHCVYPTAPSPLYYRLPAYGLKLFFYPAHFIQVNQSMNIQMIAQALKWLDLQAEDHVLDLFCGIGNFTLPMAKYVKQVVGVEGSSFSIDQARENANLNQCHNTAFYVHDLTTSIEQTDWFHQSYTKILLDPPRAGAKELMPYIKNWMPKRIVYVSCNPITLARDTEYLLNLNYELMTAGVMDMFPHTAHVEAMALFRLKT